MADNKLPQQDKEPLQNECAFDKKHLTQALHGSRKKSSLIFFACAVLVAAVSIAAAVLWVAAEERFVIIALDALVIALIAFQMFFYPGIVARTQMARIRESFHCDGYDTRTEFTDTGINSYNRTIGQSISVGYDVVRRVKETRDMILLITKERQLFLLDKERFVDGTQEEFWHLIFDKCPTAKFERRPAK